MPGSFQFTRPRGARREALRRALRRHRVSIHAPARGATRARRDDRAAGGVSIHAPARGATSRGRGRPPARCGFNSRAREGRDLFLPGARHRGRCFNSRAREGRDTKTGIPRRSPRCFNSRAREGRDGRRAERGRCGLVSIHAPARGATRIRETGVVERSFNSRAREGRDWNGSNWEDYWKGFNSRAREGRDMSGIVKSVNVDKFQFTRPRGARRRRWRSCASGGCFNSRAREGRDAGFWRRRRLIGRFNSRAREGRDDGERDHVAAPPFQFTRPRGARREREVARLAVGVSIHAPARGATRDDAFVLLMDPFQFTRPRGARPGEPGELVRREVVSIHAPARGATLDTFRLPPR